VRSGGGLSRLQRAGVLPDLDYVLNHVVSRIPLVAMRMRAYASLGVQFDQVESAMIALGVEMWRGNALSMGRGSAIGPRCYIDARAGIRVEPHVSISREVCVLTATHQVDSPDFEASLAPVHFASHCWIGARALVLPGVHVGEGAVVGAGAVVSRDVAPYSVVGGVPAKFLRERSQPMSYELDWRPNWY
jgi:putative colanic acid biosynthesis acetyltransferase WcaF